MNNLIITGLLAYLLLALLVSPTIFFDRFRGNKTAKIFWQNTWAAYYDAYGRKRNLINILRVNIWAICSIPAFLAILIIDIFRGIATVLATTDDEI